MLDVFDRSVIARCQIHKRRNVIDKLPVKMRGTVDSKMRAAYYADSALAAKVMLSALAAELDKTHPSAAAILREGMTETLTILRLGVPPTLARTLRSTNAIESMISICRDHASALLVGLLVELREVRVVVVELGVTVDSGEAVPSFGFAFVAS